MILYSLCVVQSQTWGPWKCICRVLLGMTLSYLGATDLYKFLGQGQFSKNMLGVLEPVQQMATDQKSNQVLILYRNHLGVQNEGRVRMFKPGGFDSVPECCLKPSSFFASTLAQTTHLRFQFNMAASSSSKKRSPSKKKESDAKKAAPKAKSSRSGKSNWAKVNQERKARVAAKKKGRTGTSCGPLEKQTNGKPSRQGADDTVCKTSRRRSLPEPPPFSREGFSGDKRCAKQLSSVEDKRCANRVSILYACRPPRLRFFAWRKWIWKQFCRWCDSISELRWWLLEWKSLFNLITMHWWSPIAV